MLANIYKTTNGIEFIGGNKASKEILQFCKYSIGSGNMKVVFTAGVLLFNHILTYKGDHGTLAPELRDCLMKISSTLHKIQD